MAKFLPSLHQLKRSTDANSFYSFGIAMFTFFTICAIIVSTLTFLGSWVSYQWELSPDSEKILNAKSSESTKILAADGSLLYEMFDKENREVIETMETLTDKPVNKNYIPLSMQYAILALEDYQFYYNENGVPLANIIGAGVECITTSGANCRGASGIYQQLVKNKTLNDEQTIDRKIQEIISSYKLGISEDVTHEQVLNLYLNTVGFGLNAHGVQKASKTYFKKDIKDVTLPQACFLAGLPQIPPNRNSNLTDPLSGDFKYFLARKDTCLENLADSKKNIKPASKAFISQEQLAIYKTEVIKIESEDTFKKYPHFVDFVIQEIAYKFLTAKGEKIAPNNIVEKETEDQKIERLAQYGTLVYDKTIKELKTGGYTIQTTIDPNIQEKLERNLAKSNVYGVGGNNYAGVTLDGPTGGIVSMVGSRDFADRIIGGENNQIGGYSPFDNNYSTFHTVGSTFKIYDYSYALSAGINPLTRLSNAPYKFGGRDNAMTNFIKSYAGTDTVNRSLAQSYNIGAAKAMWIGGNGPNPNFASYDQGMKAVDGLYDFGSSMGLVYARSKKSMTEGAYTANPSPMAIGTEDVNLLTHATGANTIAQGGRLRTATPFVAIKYQERDIYKERMALGDKSPYKNNEKAIEEGVANQISRILNVQDNNSLLRGSRVPEGWNFSAKTGTATRSKDGKEEREAELSVISWSPKYTSLMWIGNTNVKASGGWDYLRGGVDSGGNLARPAMMPYMAELHDGKPGQQFNTAGLSEFRGQLLTDKQKSLYSQIRGTY
jgi:penicillin-binding protein 1A